MPTDLLAGTGIPCQQKRSCLRPFCSSDKSGHSRPWTLGSDKTTPRCPSACTAQVSHLAARNRTHKSNKTSPFAASLNLNPQGKWALQYQVHIELKEITKCNLITRRHPLLITQSCQKHQRLHSTVSEERGSDKIKDKAGGGWWVGGH